jgi:hypothetical protein
MNEEKSVEAQARELLEVEYAKERMTLACEGPDAIDGTWVFRKDKAALRAIEKALTRSTTPAEDAVEAVARAMAYVDHPTLYWPGDKGRTYQSIGAGKRPCLYEIDEATCNKFRSFARAAISAYDRTRGVESARLSPSQYTHLEGCNFSQSPIRLCDCPYPLLKAEPAASGIERLVEALKVADRALRNYACEGPGAPCLRTPAQCGDNCGLGAAQALEAVESALSSLKESGR